MDFEDTLWTVLGAGLVLLLLVDVFRTLLYTHGSGPLGRAIMRGFWLAVRRTDAPRGAGRTRGGPPRQIRPFRSHLFRRVRQLRAATAPAPSRGQPPGTLQRRATHHLREGSPKLCGHYGPIWSCGNRGDWHWAEGTLSEQGAAKRTSAGGRTM